MIDREPGQAQRRASTQPAPTATNGGAGFKPAPTVDTTGGCPDAAGDRWAPLEDLISRDLFKAEVKAWAQRIGVNPREVHLRPMRRKWGSCSTSGRLTFNEELLAAPPEIRRRVIVEELLHLKVPNHGKLFKALLKSYLEMG